MANQNLSDRNNSKNKGNFSELTDTPASYSNSAGKMVAVKADQSGLEYVDLPSSEIPDNSIEYIKLKTIELVFDSEEVPITLTNPADSGIADDDIAGYQIWLNHTTWEVRFRALTAEQLQVPEGSFHNINDGYPQHIHYSKGQKFWSHMQQWDKYAESPEYENFNIIIKAKEPDP